MTISTMPPARHLQIAGTYNIRDLGGYPTPNGETRWRRILRADALHRVDADGMAMLIAEGVATVIDLRHPEELKTRPNPFQQSDVVRYHNINLFDQLAPQPQAGEEILFTRYKAALDTHQPSIIEVMAIIADAPAGAVLFHCTAGKDRTGIIAALLLALVEVDAARIIEDYALTGPMIAPLIEEFVQEAAAQGADLDNFRRLLAAEPQTMAETIAYLGERYGSAADYLEICGMSAAAIDRLRQRLLADTAFR